MDCYCVSVIFTDSQYQMLQKILENPNFYGCFSRMTKAWTSSEKIGVLLSWNPALSKIIHESTWKHTVNTYFNYSVICISLICFLKCLYIFHSIPKMMNTLWKLSLYIMYSHHDCKSLNRNTTFIIFLVTLTVIFSTWAVIICRF